MVTKYVHTNIVSEDWEKLARFYQDVFSCIPVPPKRSLSGNWLAEGTGVPEAEIEGMHLRLPGYGKDGPTLEIFQYSHVEGGAPAAANGKGYSHIAFSVDDVEAVWEAVLAHGGSELGKVVTTKVAGREITLVYMRDPEGNIVEIQKWS